MPMMVSATVLVPVARAELRVGDEPNRALVQWVNGVEQPTGLANVEHRVPDRRGRM
jgi:hypothetical protein